MHDPPLIVDDLLVMMHSPPLMVLDLLVIMHSPPLMVYMCVGDKLCAVDHSESPTH